MRDPSTSERERVFAEFAYNNVIHASTKVTPFYAYTGCHPRWCALEIPEVSTNPCAEDRLERLRKIQADLSTQLQHAQQSHKDYADLHRLPSSFNIGDRVWLLRRHMKTTRPCEKLDYRRLGPFCIIEKINDVAFRLELRCYLRNFKYIRCFIVLSSNHIKRASFQDVLHSLHPRSSLKMDLSMRSPRILELSMRSPPSLIPRLFATSSTI